MFKNLSNIGDEPEGVSPKGTHVGPEPSGKGLKFVGETSSAVLTGEQEEGPLAAAQAPPPVKGRETDGRVL